MSTNTRVRGEPVYTSVENRAKEGILGYAISELGEELIEIRRSQPESYVLEVSYTDLLAYARRIDGYEAVSQIEEVEDEIKSATRSVWRMDEFYELYDGVSKDEFDAIEDEFDSSILTIALTDAETAVDISDDISEHTGDVVELEGIARHITRPRGVVVAAAYRCRCGNITYVRSPGRFAPTSAKNVGECEMCENSGFWSFDIDESYTQSYQQISVQEAPEHGRTSNPREVEIDVYGAERMDLCQAGDRVTVTGLVRSEQEYKSSLLMTWLDAYSVVPQESSFREIDLTEEDIARIKQLAGRDDLYEILSDSIAPHIYGYEEEKLGLAISLFGGVTRWTPEGSRLRGESHVLFIGDPGTAKSELQQYASEIAPRSMTAVGRQASAAGLTAAAVSRKIGGVATWVLEAGALVLANEGVLVIDELDKAHEDDLKTLYEPMQHGHISISKAGINAELQANTTVFAAANPRHGRWDMSQPMSDQFELPWPLVSRFDLVFTFQDEVDAYRDEKIVQSQLAARQAGLDNPPQAGTSADAGNSGPVIPKDTYRRYIAYARRLTPVFSDEAVDCIHSVVVELRQSESYDTIPVTHRIGPAIARLAEAAARAQLSETVTMEHADVAVKLVLASLRGIGIDPETGVLDAAIAESGISRTQTERVQLVKDAIDIVSEDGSTSASKQAVIAVCSDEWGMDSDSIEYILQSLLEQGHVFEGDDGLLRAN